jgi:hypothetical protein
MMFAGDNELENAQLECVQVFIVAFVCVHVCVCMSVCECVYVGVCVHQFAVALVAWADWLQGKGTSGT